MEIEHERIDLRTARRSAARAGDAAMREIVEKLLIDIAGLCVAARNTDYVQRRARRLGSCAARCTAHRPRARARRGRRGVRQRHRGARRGLRRHLRGRAGARRRGGRAGGARGRRAGAALRGRCCCAASRSASSSCAARAWSRPSSSTRRASIPPRCSARWRRRRASPRRCLPRARFVNALGIAGSMASGIIEYLAEGTWTKRLHPGLGGAVGHPRRRPRARGLRRAAHRVRRHARLLPRLRAHHAGRLGEARRRLRQALGHAETLAFKPYACGTMTHPYIDCAARLAKKIDIDDIEEIVCEAAEGTVHRLWEPLAAKQRAAQRLRRQVQPALLHRRRLRPRPRRAGRVHRGARARPAAARAGGQGALRDRSGQSAIPTSSPGTCACA